MRGMIFFIFSAVRAQRTIYFSSVVIRLSGSACRSIEEVGVQRKRGSETKIGIEIEIVIGTIGM